MPIFLPLDDKLREDLSQIQQYIAKRKAVIRAAMANELVEDVDFEVNVRIANELCSSSPGAVTAAELTLTHLLQTGFRTKTNAICELAFVLKGLGDRDVEKHLGKPPNIILRQTAKALDLSDEEMRVGLKRALSEAGLEIKGTISSRGIF